jgi:hypothetical protein
MERPDITMDIIDRFLDQMCGGSRADFVFRVAERCAFV